MPVIQVVLDKLRNRLSRRHVCLRLGRPTALFLLASLVPGTAALAAGALGVHDASAGFVSLRPDRGTRMATVTTMSVSATSPAGGLATLTATEQAANGSHPAGWMQFEADSTDIGAPVAVSPVGVARTTAAFSGAAPAMLTAAFTPAGTGYLASAAASGARTGATDPNAGSVALTVTVPLSGFFTVTVSPSTVILQKPTRLGVATGLLQKVILSDTRNWYPGWSVSGQTSSVVGKGHVARQTISGTELGWDPAGTLTDGADFGPAIAPGSPGLGTAGGVLALASMGSGFGTETLSATLTLVMPRTAGPGPYHGLLTITYVEAALQAPASSPAVFPPAR